MKLQNIAVSASLLAIFILATLNLVVGLFQFAIEVTQAILTAILFIAKIACKAIKGTQQLLYFFDWLLCEIDSTINSIYSFLEDWMVSTVPSDATDNPQTLLLIGASIPSERTAFEENAIARSLEVLVTPMLLAPGTATIPSEKTEPDETIAQVTAKPLGKVITIGETEKLIALSVPGVYVQRTPKKKKTKRELNALTVPQLRDRIAKAVENNSSLVVPKKSANKPVLVDWLLVNQ